jgi:cysteine desulfurase/selenocysteine lyase
MGIASTARASFGVYNDLSEIDRLADAVGEIVAAARGSTSRRGVGAPIEAGSQSLDAASGIDLYPRAVAASPEAAADEIAEIFELLPDWPMRHQQIMDLGERLPRMPDALKTQDTFVPGCQSRVYLAARVQPGSDDVIEFLADSDANIVRGLIALLQQIYSGQKAGAIVAFDAQAFFSRLGLDEHLSMTRRNGLVAMVDRLRRVAAERCRSV